MTLKEGIRSAGIVKACGWCGVEFTATRTPQGPRKTCSDPCRRALAAKHKTRLPRTCTIEGCNSHVRNLGLCNAHYRRLRKTGGYELLPRPSGETHPRWAGEQVTYYGTHLRLRRTRGKADQFPCVDCGKPAQSWSYNHDAPDEKTDAKGRAYSGDPAHYSPKCNSCHTIADKVTANIRKRTAS